MLTGFEICGLKVADNRRTDPGCQTSYINEKFTRILSMKSHNYLSRPGDIDPLWLVKA